MGLPAVNKEGVKCTYFVLRKDFLLGHSEAPKLPTPPAQSILGSTEFDNGRPKTSESEKAPRGRTLLQHSDTSNDCMELNFGETCKHMISQSLADRSSNCEFCRGEKLVEEAARNNDLFAEEVDDLSSEHHSGGMPDDLKEYDGNKNSSLELPLNKFTELPSDIASKTDARIFKRLWRTLCSSYATEPPLANHPLVLASVRLSENTSRLLVYNPPKSI